MYYHNNYGSIIDYIGQIYVEKVNYFSLIIIKSNYNY